MLCVSFHTKKAVIILDGSSFESLAVVYLFRPVRHRPQLNRTSVGLNLFQSCGPAICSQEILLRDTKFFLCHNLLFWGRKGNPFPTQNQ